MTTKKRETLQIERIPFQFQLDQQSDFESGRFSGIASVFGSTVDTYPQRTRIKPGAFLKSINDRFSRVKILLAHDAGSLWIGLPTKLQETGEGLLVEGSLNNTAMGKDVSEAMRHAAALGKLDAIEFSIGFDALSWDLVEQEDEEVIREISELRLWEVSVVPFGADRQTRATEVASRDALERALLPKHQAESLALAITHNVDSLEDVLGPLGEHSEMSETTRRFLTQACASLKEILEAEAGPTDESPTETNAELDMETLEVELIEAEARCLELGVQP